jgi:hypothetical protein
MRTTFAPLSKQVRFLFEILKRTLFFARPRAVFDLRKLVNGDHIIVG